MAKNGFVTTRFCEANCGRLEKRLDTVDSKLDGINDKVIRTETCVDELKKHFNESLEETIEKRMANYSSNLSLRNAVIIAIISAVVSFGVAILI